MIQVTNIRNRDGEEFEPATRSLIVVQALDSFILYELGFGTVIREITPTRVVCLTRVMNCLDTVIFEGKVEEMRLLVEAAILYCQARKIDTLQAAFIDHTLKVTKGNPLLIKMGMGILYGNAAIRAVILAMIGNIEFKHIDLDVKDLLAIMALIRIDGCPIEDVLATV